MEALKNKILEEIPVYCKGKFNWHSIDEIDGVVYEKNGYKIYGHIIQEALDKYKCVKIPKMDTLYLDKPIIMKSGYRLWLDKEQKISNLPNLKTCLIRNENLLSGENEPAVLKNPDRNISIDGGIWDGALDKTVGEQKLQTGETPEYKGALSIMIFSNVENLVIKNAEFLNGGPNYAIQLSCISKFRVSELKFIKYGRDGVHVNGPASYGEICNLHGEDMGDDMVAFNAWDWDLSAITFGTIEYLYVHDNKSTNNELRLLPGRKMYKDSFSECDIKDCVLENLSGIYTFKLYCQPNIENAITKGYNDVSGTVGNIYNVWFKNIKINENKQSGFNDLPVNGIFDICANCHDLHFEDIDILYTKDALKKKNMSFVSVGPLSAVWTNGSDNPEDWGEVFDPDAVCHVEDIYFKNISFADGIAVKMEDLIREVEMQLNPDYPNTKPKGGTGYGTIGKILICK